MARLAAAALVFAALGLGLGLDVSADRRSGTAAEATEEPLFDEPFSGRRLDRSQWNRCHWWAERGCTIATNNELEWYLPGQVRVDGGRLHLTAERRRVRTEDGAVYRFRSGMISSGPRHSEARPLFAFRYGHAEIRARVPKGRGLWSAFWLLPADLESEPEIDVMEILGRRPGTVEMHLHPGAGMESLRRAWRHPAIKRGWHTFGIDWAPGRLVWRVDGKVRWRVRGPVVPAEPMYLIVNLAVGGDWAGRPNGATQFPATLAIDRIRVWR